ncbi:MAG: DUF2252 family protein [Bacteriovorax sp.]|nr:DUF2252 family protein [Bacteriovorax sp.]
MKTTLKIIVLLFCINLTQAQEASSLIDTNYQFDGQKLEASSDTFIFARSFVDYYYGLMAKNTSQLNIAHAASSFSGWCVGDAHPENFGILLQNNSKILFSMNDMDDFGPCPLAYDFLRLLVTSRLYLPKINIEQIRNSYLIGLRKENFTAPLLIQTLASDSQKLGENIDPKKLDGNKFKRKNGMSEVSPAIYQIIASNLAAIFIQKGFVNGDLRVMDIISTSRIGGGSGGLLRYEVLCLKGNKDLIRLELKELSLPAIYPVATATIPSQSERMTKALQVEQGNTYSTYYNVFLVGEKTMLLRPKFAGNKGITLTNSSDQDNTEIISYEAFILGRIHAASAEASYTDVMKNLSPVDLESDVTNFTNFLNKKFNEIKRVIPVH